MNQRDRFSRAAIFFARSGSVLLGAPFVDGSAHAQPAGSTTVGYEVTKSQTVTNAPYGSVGRKTTDRETRVGNTNEISRHGFSESTGSEGARRRRTRPVGRERGASNRRLRAHSRFHRVERRFPAKVVQYDPFTGVASGLAVANYYGIGNQP